MFYARRKERSEKFCSTDFAYIDILHSFQSVENFLVQGGVFYDFPQSAFDFPRGESREEIGVCHHFAGLMKSADDIFDAA